MPGGSPFEEGLAQHHSRRSAIEDDLANFERVLRALFSHHAPSCVALARIGGDIGGYIGDESTVIIFNYISSL